MDQYITNGMHASAATYLYINAKLTSIAAHLTRSIPTPLHPTMTKKSYNIHVKRRLSNGEEEGSPPTKTTTTTYPIFSPRLKSEIIYSYHGSLIFGEHRIDKKRVEARTKIAAFDLDKTLIKTKGKSNYPRDEHDWLWLYKTIPRQLKQVYDEGYKVVIITNQAGLDIKKKSEKLRKDFLNKIRHISAQLEIPFQIFIATSKDKYRKPMTGTWWYLTEKCNADVYVGTADISESFYVGDAAGRPTNWKPGKAADWADTDRKFAENIGLKFYTPEEYFQGEAAVPYFYGDFDPKDVKNVPLFTPSDTPLVPEPPHPELIICVGPPAIGKSTFVKKHLIPMGYVHINQDTLKSRVKCLQASHQALAADKSVVVDNTNPDMNSRKEFIDIAKVYGVPTRCFWFVGGEMLAKHNNSYRSQADDEGKLIPDVAYRTFKSRFEEPTPSEGFAEIKQINFIFEGTDEERK
ncbi:2952_t:CDS:10, partial [Paraglomus occultum]